MKIDFNPAVGAGRDPPLHGSFKLIDRFIFILRCDCSAVMGVYMKESCSTVKIPTP